MPERPRAGATGDRGNNVDLATLRFAMGGFPAPWSPNSGSMSQLTPWQTTGSSEGEPRQLLDVGGPAAN